MPGPITIVNGEAEMACMESTLLTLCMDQMNLKNPKVNDVPTHESSSPYRIWGLGDSFFLLGIERALIYNTKSVTLKPEDHPTEPIQEDHPETNKAQ